MDWKFAAHLKPGDRITFRDIEQTVTCAEPWPTSSDTAVYTDYTGDDPWLVNPGKHITVHPAA
jgi:hypothetical protein